MTTEQWHPGSLLELSGIYWKTCTLHTAVKLDLFSAVGTGRISAEELAGQTGLNPDGLTRLLNALCAMGLLTCNEGVYANTEAARKFLVASSEQYIGYMIMHHHHLMDSWNRLSESVRTGRALDFAEEEDEKERESFLMGMFNAAMHTAPLIAKVLDLSGRRRLLDLGGGPGTYAIHFCQCYPELRAVVYDLPTTRPFAEKTIARFGLEQRITFQPGDYSQDEVAESYVTGTYDAAWLSHVLHGEGPQQCLKMIKKAAAGLSVGGVLTIHEFILDDDMQSPLFATLFSMNMLLHTDGGRAYSESELRGMLQHAGLKNIRRIPVQTPNQSGLICAFK